MPILTELHSRPTLRRQHHAEGLDSDVFDEPKAMLELSIGRALARCGAETGYTVLLNYLRDNRALLARAAHSELALLLGRDLGDDPASWEAACQRREPAPAAPPERYDLTALDGALTLAFDD